MFSEQREPGAATILGLMWGAGPLSSRSIGAKALSSLLAFAACVAGCSSGSTQVRVSEPPDGGTDDAGPTDSSVVTMRADGALADGEASVLARIDAPASDSQGDSTASADGEAADATKPDGAEASPRNEAGADGGEAGATGEGADGGADETGEPPTGVQDAGADTQILGDDGGGATDEGGSIDGSESDAATFPVVTLVPPCTSAVATGSTLFDLGHGSQVSVLKQSGNRLLSEDTSGHWILWSLTTKLPVVTGDATSDPSNNPALPQLGGTQNGTLGPGVFSVDLAGGTMAVAGAASITLLSAVDGHMLQAVAIDNTMVDVYGLASDGSYLWVAGQGGLQAYTTAGKRVVNRTSGDYSSSNIFAAPSSLEVGASPVGDLELVSIATGASQVPLRSGTLPNGFGTWFTDGNRFVTAGQNGTTVITVYSSAGAKVSETTLAQNVQAVGGFGPVYWASGQNGQSSAPQVFAVSGGANPVWTEANPNNLNSSIFAAGSLLAFSDTGSTQLHVLDLSSVTVRDTDVDVGSIGFFNTSPGTVGLFDADATGNWAFTDSLTGSLVFDGADALGPGGPIPLDCGAVQAIAGGAGGRVAVATAAGQVLFADVSITARTVLGALGFPATGLAISDDGGVLAALGPTLRIFDLPTGTNPVTLETTPSDLLALARGGGTLGLVSPLGTDFAGAEFVRRLFNASTGAILLNDSVPAQPGIIAPLALSPSGLAAITDFSLDPASAQATTNIFRNGAIVGTANGYPVGWLDDARLVVNTFGAPDAAPSNFVSFSGANICDTTGRVLAPLPVPVQLQTLTPVGSTQFYDPWSDAIYDLDGGVAWGGPAGATVAIGDVAGPFVVVAIDHRVVLETRP
jgi:hypothetical protein